MHGQSNDDIYKQKALPFYLPYSVPILSVISHCYPNPFYNLLPTIFVWIIVPVLDYLLSFILPKNDQQKNIIINQYARRKLESRISFRVAIYFWPLVHILMLIWGISLLKVEKNQLSYPFLRFVSICSSLSLVAAESINCAHEMLHRRDKFEKFIGHILLSLVCYGHFSIEHSRGHHVKVATPKDPATMKYGQSFYEFLPHTIVYGFFSAWRLENERLSAASSYTWIFQNEIIQSYFLSISWGGALFILYGKIGLYLFVIQSIAAIILLEQVNAIEHYGLKRSEREDGTFEPVGPRHSWDAPQTISSYFMFKLQLHADHHIHVSHRYQSLQLTERSPKLPGGYLSLAPLLWFPPLWRRVMDPVLHKYWKQWEDEDRLKVSPKDISK